MKYNPIFLFYFSLLLFSSCNNKEVSTPTDSFILYGTPDDSLAHNGVVYVEMADGACSGTLIAPDVVMTAAHCISHYSTMHVYFGNEYPFQDSRDVIKSETHPEWDPDNITNDIGLIRLDSPAPQNTTVVPPLPASLALDSTEIDLLQLNFVGFGLTETGDSGRKLQMTQPLWQLCEASGNYCQVSVPDAGGNSIQIYMPPGTLAIQMNEGGGICHGDSGGPAFITRDGTEYVAGISSFVIHNNQDECDFFGAATIVDNFNSFINDFLHSEICNNGIDDDDDGDIDCDDVECADDENCIPNACDAPIQLECGDSLTGNTSSNEAYTSWSYYNSTCSSGFTEEGPEIAYELTAPNGQQVTAQLTINNSNTDLELFLLENSCQASSCTTASTNAPGVSEEISYLSDGNTHYFVVDTWQNPGEFTLTINCEVVTPPDEDCTNQIDDDYDGDVDCDDSDCFNNIACGENCENGIDDDNDSFIDCDDADCFHTLVCVSKREICDNQIDDDHDGAIDCNDIDCSDDTTCNITVQEECDNGIDDNGDSKIDCNDPLCKTSYLCAHPVEICDNGMDDDGDRLVDCDDADCQSFAGCEVTEGTEICLNGLDDDDNGLTDCQDPACDSHHYCNMTKDITYINGVKGCSCYALGSHSERPNLPLIFMFMLGLITFRKIL